MRGTDLWKGAGAGLLVGACIGMAVKTTKKARKRRLGRAVRAMSQVIEDISEAVKL